MSISPNQIAQQVVESILAQKLSPGERLGEQELADLFGVSRTLVREALKAGRSIQCPVYSYVDHNRTDETVEVFPTKVIIVEGILIFQDPTLRDMFDIKIFVETDADVRILRRALRDIRDRGRTLESVITQYLTTVKPMHEQYVEPSRKYADIIVLEGGHNLVALDMIMQRIASHIASED